MSLDRKNWKFAADDEPFLRLSGKLLEGPIYDPDTDLLWFTDIGLDLMHSVKVSEGPQSLRTFPVEGNTVGSISLLENSKDLLLVGAKYGFATFNTTSGKIVNYKSYHDDGATHADQRRFRANDGAIDARGRIFMGILLDDKLEPPGPEGKLICLNLDGQIHTVVENVTTPNGIGWNSTNTIMYWAESFSGNVYKFEYDVETGRATNQAVFFTVPGFDPHANLRVPDGLVVDVEDHVWLAIWGGCKVLRISPDGRVVGRVELIGRFITSVVLVGTELCITTAEESNLVDCPGLDEYSGHIYKMDVGVRGLPRHRGRLPSWVNMSSLV